MSDFSSLTPDPSMVGGVPTPPFVRLPDPSALFRARAARFAQLAVDHPLGAYLKFLAGVAQAQHDAATELDPPRPPDAAQIERATAYGMPPLDRSTFDGAAMQAALRAVLDRVVVLDMPAVAASALAKARDPALQGELLRNVLAESIPADALAEHGFAAAALQVQFALHAASLGTAKLVPVHVGACPACGGAPVASTIVGWIGAESTRYCACSLCGTLWNYVRIKCVLCGANDKISYREIEDTAGTIKAECCGSCGSYVKILQQHKDHQLEPIADDVASLGLDLLLRETEFRRGGFNPFLLGG